MEYQEIIARQKEVLAREPKPIPEDRMAAARELYTKRNKKSLELFEKAKSVIPGGVEHNLSQNNPFPIAMDRGKGYRVWDIDGNEYIDYLMCGAPIMLGHAYSPLDDKIIDIIKTKGPATGLTSEYELLAAEEIVKNLPGVDMVRFLQSGTEADMAALRIARAYTGKKKVIKVGGSYHGWSDQMVYSLHIPGSGPLYSKGITPESYAHIIDVKPNDFDALEKAFKDNADDLAAAIVEPVGGESGAHPVHPNWNKTMRELCDKYKALLIFDEVVTAFRLDMGGAQKVFNIMPDITVLGKIIGHGYPSCGAVAGRKEVMAMCHGSLGNKIYVGGTLAANPITTAACYYTLKLMAENDAVGKATDYANRLTKAMNDLFATRADLGFFVYNFGPIMQYVTTGFFAVDVSAPDALKQVLIRKAVADNYQIVTAGLGLCSLAGTRMYTCMVHDDESMKKTLAIWDQLLSLIPKG
ncbi:MAG TPA: aminotransferase class III-fold pyridoxal phosphate-dependent enzyme [Spirochaetota bacterium]|nr:aminotransferase class III-fold pyridoxal phosphate-dependent enzyme [Spirochaetota bacterium]HOD15388.1 aminotransferase class III-fold pyridoxal phosphate-dependent enzyme [Spirochaetota bacterium]HPG51512.1 aminotransferase class III-fold pyridoxal phosphate-dependent enzyme [Spirochaetota bacterium]HPN11254.1 aminotransferase class III-fold pyridoxal phosphate-dependent enzyme [Spirochaetota bacterium]